MEKDKINKSRNAAPAFTLYDIAPPTKPCTVLAVFFPHSFVVVLALRQQGCVLRLAVRKKSSPINVQALIGEAIASKSKILKHCKNADGLN